MVTWNDVASTKEYQDATPDKRAEAQNIFFDKYVSPRLSEGTNLDDARSIFISRASEAEFQDVKGVMSKAQEAPPSHWTTEIASPDRIAELKAMPPLSLYEAWDKLNKWGTLPFVNVVGTAEDVLVLNTINKMREGKEVTPSEEADVQAYMEDMVEMEARGVSVGGQILSLAAQMPAFGVEMWATKGGYTKVKGVVLGEKYLAQKALKQAAKGMVEKGAAAFASRAAAKAADLTAQAAVQTVLSPHRVVGAYANRAINESVAITEKGELVFQEAKTAPATAVMKAMTDVWVEYFTEGTGEFIATPLNKLAGKASSIVLPKKLADALDAASKSSVGVGFSKAMSKLGYNGILAEIGEERLGDALRYGLNLDQFEGKDLSFDDFLNAVTPSPEQFLVEVGAIAMYGTASRVGYGLYRRLMDRGYTQKQAKDIVEGMTQTEQRAALEKLYATSKEATAPKPSAKAFKNVAPDAPLVEKSEALTEALTVLESYTEEQRMELAEKIVDSGMSSVVRRKADEIESEIALEYSTSVEPDLKKIAKLEKQLQNIRSVSKNEFSEAKANRIVKQATKIAETDVRAARDVLASFVTESKISDEAKVKELKSINRIKNSTDAANKIQKIHARVAEAARKQAVADASLKIKTALKRAKAKKVEGRRRAKVDADTTRRVNELLAVLKLPATKARALADGGTLADDPLMATLAAIRAGDPVSVGMAQTASDAVEEMIRTGKTAVADIKAQKAQVLKQAHDKVMAAMGDVPSTSKTGINKTLTQEIPRKLLSWAGVWRLRWKLAFTSSNGKLVNDLLDNELSLFEENLKYDVMRKKRTQRATELMLKHTNMSEKALMKKLWEDELEEVRIADGAALLHADGKKRPVTLTRGQMRYLWVQSRNSKGRSALLSEKGNMLTADILNTIEGHMTAEDVGIAKALTEFYAEYFPEINSFVERTQGVSLQQEQYYSPMMRDMEHDDAEGFMEAMMFFQKRSPRAIKEREGGDHPLKLLSDFSTLVSHISEMEYYMNVGEKANMLERLVSSAEVKQRVRDVAGEQMLKDLQKDARYFSTRGRHEQQFVSSTLNTIVRNFQGSVLLANPQIGLKQLTSFPAFVQGVSTKDFVAGLMDMLAHPLKARDVLRQSLFLQDRYGGLESLDRAFSDLASDRSRLNVLGKRPKLRALLGLPIKLGDGGAISIGGYAHYYAKRKAGASHTEALRSMELIAVRTQQSGQIAEQSFLQREPNFAARILTNFMSAPNALARAEYEALLDGMKGRITKAEAAKRLIVYHVLIPNLFMLMANAGRVHLDDQLKATLLGSLNGIFLIGSLIDSVVTWAVSGNLWELKSRHPLEFATDFIKALKQFDKDGLDVEDFFEGSKAINGALKATGSIFGVPLDKAYNEMVGGVHMLEGDIAEGSALMLGYSPWVVEKKILNKD